MSDSMREAEGVRVGIITRCPTCGHGTVFVGSGGHLTCSWLACKNPSIGDAIARLKTIEQVLAFFVDNASGYDKSLAGVAATALQQPEYYDREYIAGELRRLETWGRELLRNQLSESPQAADAVARSAGTSTD